MKLNTVVRNVESNVENSREFTIETSPKAFQILSSNLYQNKIKAIIRELSCNAYDSHVAAGKSHIPFSIHLPNNISPYFYIRDYGTGLSNEQLYEIYTSYFMSTKVDSDDFVGCLGLGSKTPFAYTDSFTVESFYNGVKSTFFVFIGENGVPQLTLVSSEDTEEPNGLLVKMSVANKDFFDFNVEAQNVLCAFDVTPKGVVINRCNHQKIYSSKINDYALNVYKEHQFFPTFGVRMGNIVYPIDLSTFPIYNFARNYRMIVDVPIGSVDFTVSRENLEYTPKTVEFIKTLTTNIDNHIVETFTGSIPKKDDSSIIDYWAGLYHHLESNVGISGFMLYNKKLAIMKPFLDEMRAEFVSSITKLFDRELTESEESICSLTKIDTILCIIHDSTVDRVASLRNTMIPLNEKKKKVLVFNCNLLKKKSETIYEELKSIGFAEDKILFTSKSNSVKKEITLPRLRDLNECPTSPQLLDKKFYYIIVSNRGNVYDIDKKQRIHNTSSFYDRINVNFMNFLKKFEQKSGVPVYIVSYVQSSLMKNYKNAIEFIDYYEENILPDLKPYKENSSVNDNYNTWILPLLSKYYPEIYKEIEEYNKNNISKGEFLILSSSEKEIKYQETPPTIEKINKFLQENYKHSVYIKDSTDYVGTKIKKMIIDELAETLRKD